MPNNNLLPLKPPIHNLLHQRINMLDRRPGQVDLREEVVDRGAVDADAVEGADAVVGLPGVDAVILLVILLGVLGVGVGY